jgi:hypothetical protein
MDNITFGGKKTAQTLSIKLNLLNDLTKSTHIPVQIKILTIGNKSHSANRGFLPISLHHSTKLTPGIQAFPASTPALGKIFDKLKQVNR